MEDRDGALLLSIKWDYASLIFCGIKAVELRRTRPRQIAGRQALIYSPSPHKVLVGGFTVSDVASGAPSGLWRRFGSLSGLTRAEFMAYFACVDVGYAIQIGDAWKLESPVPLDVLRERMPDFHPPQVYRYLDRADRDRLVV